MVVRTEACNLCYSNVGAVLGIQAAPPATGAATPANAGLTGANTNDMALIQGHGGVGVVEAVGPDVRRVQVGDRVCVSGTPQCGACYHCLRGRADVCQLLGRNLAGDLAPVADLRDGTPVYSNSHIGGLAELMITPEEWVVPVVTKANAVDLGMVLSCVSVAVFMCTLLCQIFFDPSQLCFDLLIHFAKLRFDAAAAGGNGFIGHDLAGR